MDEPAPGASLFGMLAEFDRAERLLDGVKQAREAGFRRVDAYSPFPIEGLADRPAHERIAPALTRAQPNLYAKLVDMLAEDVKESAMTAETAATIIKPTEVVIEAFDAALSGRRAGERQGTIVVEAKVGRNEPCPCGSGKKYKKCHGEIA